MKDWHRELATSASRLPCRLAAAKFALLVMTSSAIAVEPPPTDARQLTKDGLLKRDPIYIESGRAILYAVRAPSPRLVLMRLDLQTGETSRYHKQSNLVEFRPTLSANGLSLAFQRMTGNDVCSLYLADLASGDERAISTGKKTSYNAALSPDGSELVYNLSGQLYRQNVSSGKELKLAHSSGRNDWPVWSPDNKQIVFASSRNGDFDLFVTSREGETIRQLTKSRGLDMRPAWSPDGEQICFTSNRDQNYELYLVRADGSNVRRLTRHDERDDFPSWSPDSKRIVYVSERGGRHDLFERTIRD